MNLFKEKLPKVTEKDIYGYKLIAPGFLFLFIVLVVPLIFVFVFSGYKWNLISQNKEFVGIHNFLNIMSDREALNSFKLTFIYVFISVFIQLVLGIAIALLLNRPFKGFKIVRVVMLLPMMLSPAVVALSWRLILHSEKGVLNYLLNLLSLDSRVWLGSGLALSSIIAVSIWMNTPFVILMILAGLQAIPKGLSDAAAIDGANWWQELTKITIPIIKPIILIAVIFRTIFELREFSLPWILTGGGPANETNLFSIELYRNAFRYYEIGRSSAMSVVLTIATLILSIIYIRAMSRESLN